MQGDLQIPSSLVALALSSPSLLLIPLSNFHRSFSTFPRIVWRNTYTQSTSVHAYIHMCTRSFRGVIARDKKAICGFSFIANLEGARLLYAYR